MRSTRTLIVVTLALCAISAHAQDPAAAAANNQQQGGLLNYLQGLPAGFDLNLLRPQAVHEHIADSANAVVNHFENGADALHQASVNAAQQAGQAGLNLAKTGLNAGVNAAQAVGQYGLNTLQQAGTVAGTVADQVSNGVAGTVQTVGNVFDTVGNVVGTASNVAAQSIKDIPSEIRGSLSDARDAFSQDYQVARQAAGAMGQFAQSAAPIIPPINQLWNHNAWRDSYKAYGSQFENTYDALETTFENIAEGISARYCTEPVYTPKTKKPAKFTGPGFSITFLTGECSIDEEALLFDHTKEIDCIKPSVVYEKTPAKFTSKYKAAPKLIGKECKIAKTFGDTITKVLYVFDGSENLPLSNLTSRITTEVQDVLGGAKAGAGAVTQQLQSFMASMPNMGHGLFDGKIGNVDLIPNFNLPSFHMPSYGGVAAMQGPPPQPTEPVASPYDQLRAALATYHQK